MRRGLLREISFFEQQQEALCTIEHNNEAYAEIYDLGEALSRSDFGDYNSPDYVTDELKDAAQIILNAIIARRYDLKKESDDLAEKFFGLKPCRPHKEWVEELDEINTRRTVEDAIKKIDTARALKRAA